ncbi:polysaccharide biosynthesis/export family protein [Inquilinus sp. CAU 1745]|uniref:polysaccharide biosynthesis/export family protein n=1 Tax=Inquilinus sp. CAU 1745 TaxID=3140369 RepID=UPI00325B4DAB
MPSLRSGARAGLALLMVAAAAAGCASPGASLPEMTAGAADAYRLDTGDEVRLTVFQQEEISGTYRVNDSGDISLPLVGGVDAEGLTSDELEGAVEASLSEGLLRDPNVSVEITSFRPFYILGEVEDPGQYPYAPGMTVLTAAAVAGGFTYRAETDYVSVTRPDETGEPEEYRADRAQPIRAGDVIYVFERFF